MNTHDLDHIPVFPETLGLAVIYVVLLQILDVADEIKETAVAGFLIIPGLLNQHFQVLCPLLSRRHGRRFLRIAGHIKNIPEQFMDRREGRLLPEILQKSVEILQFFPKLLVLPVFPVPAAALMEGFFLPAAAPD